MEVFKIKCQITWLYIVRAYYYCMLYFWRTIGFINKRLIGVIKYE